MRVARWTFRTDLRKQKQMGTLHRYANKLTCGTSCAVTHGEDRWSADDHPLYREGLAGLLGTTEDLCVVGQASTGLQAVALVTDLDSDLLVLDLDMPDSFASVYLHT